MAHTATLQRWGDEFYFVSDDGEHYYEVTGIPESDADLDPLRPLGVRGTTHLLSFSRRWLDILGHDSETESLEWGTLR